LLGLRNEHGVGIVNKIDDTPGSSVYLYDRIRFCKSLFDLHEKLRLVPLVNTPFPRGFRHIHRHAYSRMNTTPFV